MFIKDSVFKKMVKSAWKGGALMVARSGGVYVIEMGKCVMNVREQCMPNKIKAILVEFIGDLPVEGCGYLYSEDGKPQAHLDVYDNLFGEFDSANVEMEATCVYIKHGAQIFVVMQSAADPEDKVLLNAGWFSLIDPKQIDAEGGEYAPGEPVRVGDYTYWGNNHMILKVANTGVDFQSDKTILSISDDLATSKDRLL